MQLQSNQDAWPLVEFYFRENPPDSSHIRSYNDFLAKIPKLATKEISYENFKCGMKDIKFIEPCVKEKGKKEKIFPSCCIAEKTSYESEITCTFYFSWKDKIFKEEQGISIGLIPVMVGSQLCNLVNNKQPKDMSKPSGKRWKEMMDMEFKTGLGGWFVKDGTSRYITFQERNKFNHPMAFINNSTSKNKKYTHFVEVRNSVTDENTTTIPAANLDKSGYCWITMKYLDDKKEIAPLLFFYALGYTDPAQIIGFIVDKNDPLLTLTYTKLFLQRLFEQATQYNWKEELSCLGMQAVDNKDEYIESLIEHKFLHHYSSKRKKAIYYGFIIHTLISISTPEQNKKELLLLFPDYQFAREDDRDHFGKKVLNTESTLFSNVFYTAVKKMIDVMEKNIITALKGKSEEMMASVVKDLNAKMIFPESDITKMPITAMLSKALTINMWGKQKRDGVSSVFDPINYNNAVTMLTRSCIPLQSHIGNLDPRMVHGSFLPFVDPFDTPEGDSIGYNKILSVMTYVSSEIDITNILQWLEKNVKPITNDIKNFKRIFVDNEWIGCQTVEKCKSIYEDLLYKKTHGQIDPTISIVWNHIKEELHIFSQEGRVLRPFLIVENGKILYDKSDYNKYATWEDLCGSGKIVMLDPNEFEFVKLWAISIDMFLSLPLKERKKYSHVEIHPATFFGAGAGSITGPNMAQGPRNSYGANMKRQAVGTTCRFDSQRTLFYPQRALVRNKIDSLLLHYDDYPAGMNVQVALMPCLGFEQEDGYIISDRFLQLGGFLTNKITKHIIQIDGNDEKLEIPKEDECFKFKPKNLQNIGPDGIIKKGSIVRMNDPLCCKVLLESNGNYKKVDCTLFHTEENICWVNDVIVSEKGYRNSKMIKIVLHETRFGKNGNKFSPRCAQKGTCTYVCPYEDMPFDPYTKTTITVIVNPLSIPSRMTINYLHEIFLGEYICMPDKDGKYLKEYENCTPFDENPVEQYKNAEKEMKRMGFRSDGRKTLIDGRTGETIETDIFCGHVHMQTLKHMVDDKISKRSTGPVATLMRCPTEGKSRLGGVKMGTMEKDCACSNDSPEIILDRFCTSSDRIETTVCRICGIIETRNKDFRTKCKVCKTDSMVPIAMSNSPKVVFSELMAMGILPRLLIGDQKK